MYFGFEIVMIKSIIFIILISTYSRALEPASPHQLANDETRDVVLKYIKNIPDIQDQYVINEKLSKAISKYFNRKISMLPLYRISLKIDRNPIKIPWTLMNNTLESRVSTKSVIKTST